jgi:MFS family permease
MRGPRLRWVRTMLAAAAMTTLGALPVFLLSAQSVLIRQELDFGEAQLGLAASAFFGAAALASLLAGALLDRLGRRFGTLVAGGLTMVVALMVAVLARSFAVLLVLLVLAGVANAAMQMTSNLTLARSVEAGQRGLAFGIKQSAIPSAILLGGLAVPTVGAVVGWRWTFVALAVAAGAVVLAGLRLPQSAVVLPDRTVDRDRPPKGALVVSAVAMVLASASTNSLGSFVPSWAFHVGLTPSEAGLLVAAGSALSVLVRVLSGALADRRRGRNLPVVSAYLVSGAVGMVVLSYDHVPALLVGTMVAFGIGWAWPGLLLFAVVRVGRDSPTAASGTIQAGAFAGGACGPAVFGLLVAATSFETAWRVAAAAMLVSASLLVVARQMFVRDLTRRPPRKPLDATPRQ